MASIVKTLSSKPVSNVVFNGRKISLDYDGAHLAFKVTRRNTCFVGNWNRHAKEIFYDAHLQDPLEVEAICIHEAIEKYITENYGLKVDGQSHLVARAIEKKWFERHKRRWIYFSRKVTKIWKIHGSC